MEPLEQWKRFLQKCLQQRVRAAQFDALAAKLHVRSPLAGARVSELLLTPTTEVACGVDPLVPVFVERLLALGIVDAPNVLQALLKGSRDYLQRNQPQADGAKDPADHQQHQNALSNPPELEDILLNQLVRQFASVERPKTPDEARQIVPIVSRWMAGMVATSTNDAVMQAVTGIDPQVQAQSVMVREALGLFLIALLENAKFVGVVKAAINKSKTFLLWLPLFALFF